MPRLPWSTLLFGVLLGGAGVAGADVPQRTLNFLTTGNGHGFQLYDTNLNKIVAFLEHPYRYLRPRDDPKSDGVGRRNLAYDVYFGIRTGGASGWLHQAQKNGDPGYVDESNIIRAPMTLGGVNADSYFFAPFGYEGNVLLALLKAPGARDGFMLFNFHMGGGSPDMPDARGESLRFVNDTQSLIETGPGGGAMVYVPLSGLTRADCSIGSGIFDKVNAGMDLGMNTSCSGDDVVPAFQKTLDAGGWLAVAMLYVDDAGAAEEAAQKIRTWANGRSPEQLFTDAQAEWDKWRRPLPAAVSLSPAEKSIWRQGEAVLRMGQVREPNTASRRNHGMILASLPKGEWHTGWVRDAMYAVVALSRSGHHEEARAALDFFLDAGPVGKYKDYVGGVDYRISVVRYFGSGEEEADYSGQPTPNIEIDGWGMFLWAARQYVDASGDVAWIGSNYDVIRRGVADALEKNLEPGGIVKADSSIWEVHDGNKNHFAYTTLAAARGFCDMATLASRAGKGGDVGHFQQVADKVSAGFLAAFLDPQGAIGGSTEALPTERYKDAAVVEAFTWNILGDYASKTAVATLDLLQGLRVESGGFKRNDQAKSDYDNNEWILIDLRMSDALRRAGRSKDADGVVQLVVDKASANFHLLPELFNAVRGNGAIGAYAGSIPMVGYGGGAFILTMLDRAGLIEPFDCGESHLTDGGMVVGPDGGGRRPGGMGSGSNLPRSTACLCRAGGPGAGPGPLVFFLWPPILLRLLRRAARR